MEDEEKWLMPPHEVEGWPCRGASRPGYVFVLEDGRWHCNRCGWVTDPAH